MSVFGDSVRGVLNKARKDVAPLMNKAGPLMASTLDAVVKPVGALGEYRERKKRNHKLAMELWELHASPIMKGIPVEAQKTDISTYSGLAVERGGDAGEEKSKMIKGMNKKEKMEFREKERADGNRKKKEVRSRRGGL